MIEEINEMTEDLMEIESKSGAILGIGLLVDYGRLMPPPLVAKAQYLVEMVADGIVTITAGPGGGGGGCTIIMSCWG